MKAEWEGFCFIAFLLAVIDVFGSRDISDSPSISCIYQFNRNLFFFTPLYKLMMIIYNIEKLSPEIQFPGFNNCDK